MKFKLKGSRVTVVGMGKSGLAAATLLSKMGSDVLIVDDQKKNRPMALPSSIRLKLGKWSENDLSTSNLVILSPGFPASKLPIDTLKTLKIPVISEVELASSLLAASLIGITGTNGKSTTTTLVGEMLQNWGLKVFVGGNLGLPLSEAVHSTWDFVVAELSSFQLETISNLRPRIAALLNITPDHLDRYPDFSSYQNAKWRIFENQDSQDYAVLNYDIPHNMPPSLQGEVIYFSRSQVLKRGVYLQGGVIQSTIWGEAEQVCSLDDLKNTCTMQLENVLAATAIAQLCGCALEKISKTLISFKGLPHRMEFVRSVRGVHYLNDSKGTNTGALMHSLEDVKPPVILIAGGKEKSTDFSVLRKIMRTKVKHLILMGEAREKMEKCFSGHLTIEAVDSMEKAVMRSLEIARPGDTVLLSPGCASFDMFRDYQDRGESFKTWVNRLA